MTAQEDLTELTHGIAIAERVAMELIDREQNLFVRRILAGVPEFMRTRREMVFITCFCGAETSKFHLEKYGHVCLKFDIPEQWIPILECENDGAESWYSPVIYGEKDQIRAAKLFLTDVAGLLPKHTNGNPEDDRGGWIASGAMRDVGQCLLTMVSCFKREKYKRDEEWRLIVVPRLGLSSSAPKMIDEAFGTCVVNNPKRHVCLRRKIPFAWGGNTLWPPPESSRGLPFDQIIRVE